MGMRLLFVALAISLLFVSHRLHAKTINMGYFTIPPHQFKGDGVRPEGAAIILFEIIAAKMGYVVNWIGPLPLPRLTEYLKKRNSLMPFDN